MKLCTSRGWLAGAVLLLGAWASPGDDDQAGLRGREALQELVGKLTARSTPKEAVPLEPVEKSYGLGFHAVESSGIRVLAMSGEDEARDVVDMLEAARGLFVELTGFAGATYPYGMTVYLIDSPAAKDMYLAKHPSLTPESRKAMAQLECSGIPPADWGFWHGDAERRVDGAVRLGLGWFCDKQGVTNVLHPWLHEGLGFYLTHALTGTHLTWFVRIREPGNAELTALLARMGDPGADWMVLARDLFAPERRFDLEELFHLTIHELDPVDYLRAYALAGYLVEVHPGSLNGLFEALAADENPRTAVETAVGCSLDELRTRLDEWLRQREVLVARAEGRRTDGELIAQWDFFQDYQREAAMEALRKAVQDLDTRQLSWMRSVLDLAPRRIAARDDLAYYDPKVHAPAQPIRRRRLSEKARRVREVLDEVRTAPHARAPRLAYDYDWGTQDVVRIDDPDDPERLFRNALLGIPPGADLARAVALEHLASPEDAKLQAAFEHAYTDREGSVFPLSLYELWASGKTMEMPDVDTLGIVHDVLDDWTTWTAPVPATQHDRLYAQIGELFLGCKRSRELRLALADMFLFPDTPPREGYETQAFNLQALWAARESDPRALGRDLPTGKNWEAFLAELVARCKRDYEYYAAGRRRAAQLRQDANELRVALGRALDAGQEATPPPPPEPVDASGAKGKGR